MFRLAAFIFLGKTKRVIWKKSESGSRFLLASEQTLLPDLFKYKFKRK